MASHFELQMLSEWNSGGFFYKIRHWDFDFEHGMRILEFLNEQKIESDAEMLMFFNCTWQIPSLMMSWKADCINKGADEKDYIHVYASLHGAISEKARTFFELKY